MESKWARAWFAVTAACVAAGVIMILVLSWQNHATRVAETGAVFPRFGGSPLNRALNNFTYFTVQSNLIVGGTSLLLAINAHRSTTVFRVFRLTGLVAITVTGIVFHVALAGLLDLESWALAADMLLHTVVPIMVVVGWLAFGPRGLTSSRVVKLTVLFPLAYMIFTIIRGPLSSDFYPYPFANVKALGYLPVIINGAWIGLLFVALAATASWLDKRLPTTQVAPAEQADPALAPRGTAWMAATWSLRAVVKGS